MCRGVRREGRWTVQEGMEASESTHMSGGSKSRRNVSTYPDACCCCGLPSVVMMGFSPSFLRFLAVSPLLLVSAMSFDGEAVDGFCPSADGPPFILSCWLPRTSSLVT